MRGGGDRPERELLRSAHVSKRIAQLAAIHAAAGDHDGGVPASFQALADVQRESQGTVAELLSSPQVGAWAAHCLRLLTAGDKDPLWTHLAQLGAVAASAAIRTNSSVRVLVPVRSGAVCFPTVGRAFVAGAATRSLVECAVAGTEVLIDGAPPAAWERVRDLRTSAGGVELSVQLDDVDPYWSSFGMPMADRLTDDELGIWRDQLDGAWQVLAERHSHRLGTMAAAVRCLVPVAQAGQVGGVSASSADAPGAIALTEPVSPVRLAATLIHESQHYRLATLHDLQRLYEFPARQLHYSPWRNDPRPASGVVHALMAFIGVADFWFRERTGDPAVELEYARHIRQLRVARRAGIEAPELTRLGKALVNELSQAIDALPLDTGAEEVRRVADDLVTEHEATWRLRNMVPRDDDLRAFRQAWREGTTLPVEHAGQPEPSDPSGDNPLTRVAMAWLENEPELRVLAADEELFAKRFPGADPNDVRLVAGDYGAAREHALARIADDTADDHTWATLVVTHGRTCPTPAHSPLARVPELVRAAFGRDVESLGELLSRYEAGTSTSDSMRR
jgi:HEXXH motif-containing protein